MPLTCDQQRRLDDAAACLRAQGLAVRARPLRQLACVGMASAVLWLQEHRDELASDEIQGSPRGRGANECAEVHPERGPGVSCRLRFGHDGPCRDQTFTWPGSLTERARIAAGAPLESLPASERYALVQRLKREDEDHRAAVRSMAILLGVSWTELPLWRRRMATSAHRLGITN